MKNLSRSLAPTDFYRLAPKGRHVSAWATGGINKIIQSVDPDTREPQGQYFLFFDSLDAAHRYRDEITTLIAQPAEPRPDQPPPLALLPPGAHLECALLPVPVDSAVLRHTTELTENASRLPHLLPRHLEHPDLESGPSSCVTLGLAGSRLTKVALLAALEADADARNMPWSMMRPENPGSAVRGLLRGSATVGYGQFGREQQVGQSVEEQQKGRLDKQQEEEEGKEKEEEGDGMENKQEREGKKDGQTQNPPHPTAYSRFVLRFTEPGEALRFVRAWHRREMVDERTNRTIVFNASALW